MRKTIYAKMTALPVGLCALAFAVTSCGSSEYKKFADNEVVASNKVKLFFFII